MHTYYMEGTMLDPIIERKARGWLSPEFGAEVNAELRELFQKQAWEELTERFYQGLGFGTPNCPDQHINIHSGKGNINTIALECRKICWPILQVSHGKTEPNIGACHRF